MAQNFVQPGNTVDIAAPAGGVVSGAPFIVGKLVGVAMVDAAAGELVATGVEGVFNLPAASGAVGDIVYFDDVADNFTTTATANTKAGVVVKAGSPNAWIKLTPGVG